jgi:hypothetical protein
MPIKVAGFSACFRSSANRRSHLVGAGYPFGHDGPCDPLERHGRDQLDLPFETALLRHGDADVLEAGRVQERPERGTEVGVAAAPADRLPIGLHPAVVRGTRRMADVAAEADVFEDRDSAGPQCRRQPGDHPGRVGHVGEQETGVRDVVARLAEVRHVLLPELDRGDPGRRGVRRGEIEHGAVEVDAEHMAVRPGATRELPADVSAAAPDVEAACAGWHADPVKERRGAGRAHPCQQIEPLLAGQPAVDRVLGRHP